MQNLTKTIQTTMRRQVENILNATAEGMLPELSLMTEAKILKLPIGVSAKVSQVRTQVIDQIQVEALKP